METKPGPYGVWCIVSGGVTGYRSAWLKKNGTLAIFRDRESAAIEARALNLRMNHAHAKAAFLYEPRRLPVDEIAQDIVDQYSA